MTLPNVAIAGASGRLGQYVVDAFLSDEFRSHFQSIKLLTRANSEALQAWAARGATIVVYDETRLDQALKDVDVLINVIGSSGTEFKGKIAQALPASAVKVYMPSEFGVDHTGHDFSHKEWSAKKDHAALVNKLAPHLKICRVYAGLFLEDSIGPWFGFNTKEGKYEAVGSGDRKISFVSKVDLGKVVARLASLPAAEIPDSVRINGDSASMSEIASTMEKHGAGEVQVSEINYKDYRSAVLEGEEAGKTAKCLRFLIGEGKIDHTASGMGNDNELVNPGEKLWKWKTLDDLAKETSGKPWADY